MVKQLQLWQAAGIAGSILLLTGFSALASVPTDADGQRHVPGQSAEPSKRSASDTLHDGAANGSATQVPPSEKLDEAKLVGAWRLVYSEMRLPDGRTYPAPNYGPNPRGYLIYDASHTMCVYLVAGKPVPLSPEMQKYWVGRPASYCGRWHIEPSGHAVIHEMEFGEPWVFRHGAKQQRRAWLDGKFLTIRSPTPEGLSDYFIRFERVQANGG